MVFVFAKCSARELGEGVVGPRGRPGGAPLVEPEGEVVQGRAEDTLAATPERQARTRRRRPTGAARVIRWSKYVA